MSCAVRRHRTPAGKTRLATCVPAAMVGWELCGVERECPCHAMCLADLTPHESSSGRVCGGVARCVPQAVPRRPLCNCHRLGHTRPGVRRPTLSARCAWCRSRARTLAARPRPHGLGGRMMPRGGVCWVLGSVGAPAPLEGSVHPQVQLASDLDHAVNPALTASIPKIVGSDLSAARRCGRVRPCTSAARNQRGDERSRRSPFKACTRRCQDTPQAPACANRGRRGDERPVVPSRQARPRFHKTVPSAVAWAKQVGTLA